MNIAEMLSAVANLEGDYAECGVYRGESALKIAAGMDRRSWLWLFDTYTGHRIPSPFDNAKAHPYGRYADTSVALVSEKLKDAKVVMGPVETTLRILDTCPSEQHRVFRFVHIDLDHYEPTKYACRFFKTRMVKGGIIRFDDYLHEECPGATKAIDEIFGKENILPEDYRWVAN